MSAGCKGHGVRRIIGEAFSSGTGKESSPHGHSRANQYSGRPATSAFHYWLLQYETALRSKNRPRPARTFGGLMHSTSRKILIALTAGSMTTSTAIIIHTLLDGTSATMHMFVADLIAGLISAIFALGIHLYYESLYYQFALERAAVFSEVNHHVRNAIFPLCLAVQKTDDPHGQRICDDAVNRINIALREAVTDVFSQKVTAAGVPKKKANAA